MRLISRPPPFVARQNRRRLAICIAAGLVAGFSVAAATPTLTQLHSFGDTHHRWEPAAKPSGGIRRRALRHHHGGRLRGCRYGIQH